MIKVVVLCILCVAIYIMHPYALYTPEQRYLRRDCSIGNVCVLSNDQEIVTDKFRPHEPKVAELVYEDSADLTKERLADFDGMFGNDVWKIARQLHRTEREKQFGPKEAYPVQINYYHREKLMWKKKL